MQTQWKTIQSWISYETAKIYENIWNVFKNQILIYQS